MASPVPPLFADRRIAEDALGPPWWGAMVHVEALWSKFYPFADRTFVVDVCRAVQGLHSASIPGPDRDKAFNLFQQRYWEMYLACSLLDRGLLLVPHGERPMAGPDLLALIGDRQVWIECIVPEPGDTADAVPDLVDGKVHNVPDDAIKLRFLNAIDKKRQKFGKYVQKGIVPEGDAQVIAINGRCVPSASTDFDPPRIARVLYGFGSPEVRYNLSSHEWSAPQLTPHPSVLKKSGARVASNLFSDGTAVELSGVIYSWLDAWNRVPDGKPDLLYIDNSNAAVRMPVGWLTGCGHYEVTVDGCVGTMTRHDA